MTQKSGAILVSKVLVSVAGPSLKSLTPNDTLRCHSRTHAIWLVFLLLQELAGNALCRILVTMVELSFGEPIRSSRLARTAHFQAFTFVHCLP